MWRTEDEGPACFELVRKNHATTAGCPRTAATQPVDYESRKGEEPGNGSDDKLHEGNTKFQQAMFFAAHEAPNRVSVKIGFSEVLQSGEVEHLVCLGREGD